LHIKARTAEVLSARRTTPSPALRNSLPWTVVTDDGADPADVKKFRDVGFDVEVA